MTNTRNEDGAVATVVALVIVPLLLLAAFAIDVGNAYAQARAFSTGADSAALAVVADFRQKLSDDPAHYSSPVRSTCTDVVNNGQADADATARAAVRSNRPFAVSIPNASISTKLSCSATGILQADVTVTQNVPTTLGRIAGVDSIAASKGARAALGTAGQVAGIRPISVCKYQADAIIASAALGDPAPAQLITVDKVWKDQGNKSCSGEKSGSGNWGWLDCGKNGNKKLAEYITDGCPPGSIDLSSGPLLIGGSPGNNGSSNPVDTAMTSLMGQTITLPVYSSISGNGANTDFTVQGFLQVELCGYGGKKGLLKDTGCFDNNPLVSPADDELQVRYSAYLTAAELAKQATCGIGDTTCGTVLATALLK